MEDKLFPEKANTPQETALSGSSTSLNKQSAKAYAPISVT